MLATRQIALNLENTDEYSLMRWIKIKTLLPGRSAGALQTAQIASAEHSPDTQPPLFPVNSAEMGYSRREEVTISCNPAACTKERERNQFHAAALVKQPAPTSHPYV